MSVFTGGHPHFSFTKETNASFHLTDMHFGYPTFKLISPLLSLTLSIGEKSDNGGLDHVESCIYFTLCLQLHIACTKCVLHVTVQTKEAGEMAWSLKVLPVVSEDITSVPNSLLYYPNTFYKPKAYLTLYFIRN